MAKIEAGSPGLFKIIQILNILFGVSALALIALGIWLWREFDAFSIIEIAFLTLGFFEFLLVLFVFTSKRSVIKLRIYLFFMMILFVLQLTAIVLVFALGDKIVDQVVEKLDEESKAQIETLKENLHKYLNIVTYYCIGVLVVVLLEMSFTYCYIGSIRNKNFEFDYKFLDENGAKITLDQKTQYDREKVAEKYEQKRQELYQKYPKYQEYKEGK